MRFIRFLSKFAFICNIAFLLFVFFRWIEQRKPVKTNTTELLQVPFLKDIIITLGLVAIIINITFCITYIALLLANRIKFISKWLAIINFLFLILQVFYFFFF